MSCEIDRCGVVRRGYFGVTSFRDLAYVGEIVVGAKGSR